MEAHAAYLKRILKGTLLSRKVKLLQQLNAITNVGHRFGETTRRLEEKTALDPLPLEDPATGAASSRTGHWANEETPLTLVVIDAASIVCVMLS